MKKPLFKSLVPAFVLFAMFITLSSLQRNERWIDIFLKGTWEDIDRSASVPQNPVVAYYGEGQVQVVSYVKHSDITIRLYVNGELVRETLMPASSPSVIFSVPAVEGQSCEIEISSDWGAYLTGSFIAN